MRAVAQVWALVNPEDVVCASPPPVDDSLESEVWRAAVVLEPEWRRLVRDGRGWTERRRLRRARQHWRLSSSERSPPSTRTKFNSIDRGIVHAAEDWRVRQGVRADAGQECGVRGRVVRVAVGRS